MSTGSKPTIILVHGAWADGSSWNAVTAACAAKGYVVLAAQIPLTGLSDDIAAVGRLVDRTEGPFILASHAYAGAVISGVKSERLKALVFIASLTPDEGETVASMFYRTDPHPMGPKLAPDPENFIWMPDESFEKAFAQNATPGQLVLMKATQRPIALPCIQEPMGAPAWKKTPSWFLVASQDRMIDPATQKFEAERMAARMVVEDVDHTPLITSPASVIKLIEEAAAAVA